MSDNRHNVGIGAFGVEILRQTGPHARTEQMAEQQDSAAAKADLEQSSALGLDPDKVVTDSFDYSLTRFSQLRFGTHMQDDSVVTFHEALMSFKGEGWFTLLSLT